MRNLLQESAWTKPDSYFGFNPVGDYVLLTRHRDSDILSESNWSVACQRMHAEPWDNGDEGYDSRPTVYHWRAWHCLVGWVEYLMVRRDAPEAILEAAAEILKSLDGYPVLDESDWSEREFGAACEYWESMSVSDRLDALRRSGSDASRFAARRSYLPSDSSGALEQYLVQ